MEGAQQADSLSPPGLSSVPASPVPPPVEEPQTQLDAPDNGLSFLWAALPIVAVVFATATLYRGRDLLMPITMAFILAVVFTPLSNILERFVGRVCSAALVVVLAIGVIAAIGYFLTVELTQVADQVAGYSDNIGNKLAALEKSSPPWLQHLKYGLAEVQRRVQKDGAAPSSPKPVEVLPVPPTMLEEVQPVLPMLDGVVEGLLISVLVFFLLYSRKDLRDRFGTPGGDGSDHGRAASNRDGGEDRQSLFIAVFVDKRSLRPLMRSSSLGSGITQRAAVGVARLRTKIHPLHWGGDGIAFTGPGGFCGFSWLDQIARGDWMLYGLRPDRRSIGRTVCDRAWYRCIAGCANAVGDVLVLALGSTRSAARDACNCLP